MRSNTDALLDARRVEAARQREFVLGPLHQSGGGAPLTGIGIDGINERFRRLQSSQHVPGSALGGGELQALCQPHRPGDDGREGEADHHRLHHPIGLHEHAPGRQVARQDGVLGRQQTLRTSERIRGRIDRAVGLDRQGSANRRCICGCRLGRRRGGCLGRRRIGGLSPRRYRRDGGRGNAKHAEDGGQMGARTIRSADQCSRHQCRVARSFAYMAAWHRKLPACRRAVLAEMRMPRNINNSSGI